MKFSLSILERLNASFSKAGTRSSKQKTLERKERQETMSQKRAMRMPVEQMRIQIAQEELDDLRIRIRSWRAPDSGPGAETWDYGTPLWFAEKLQQFWLNEFDWRGQETKLNEMGHFRAQLGPEFENIWIHFVHSAPKSENAGRIPILLLHGWPGSIWEFRRLIPLLNDAGYRVVAPSLPGYGFSEPPQERGWNTRRIASAMDALMKGLGFDAYFAQGGDWGSEVCKNLGAYPEKCGCLALHLNMHSCGPPNGFDPKNATDEEKERLARTQYLRKHEFAYQQIQGTKPQSIGYGLTDSPMGLACWIAEKFHAWTDSGEDPCEAVSMEDLLTNICIYWFTFSYTSSARLYYETLGVGNNAREKVPFVQVPCSIAIFPKEILVSPISWIKNAFNVVNITKFEKGGHFAALEVPEDLAKDIIAYFDSAAAKSPPKSKL